MRTYHTDNAHHMAHSTPYNIMCRVWFVIVYHIQTTLVRGKHTKVKSYLAQQRYYGVLVE